MNLKFLESLFWEELFRKVITWGVDNLVSLVISVLLLFISLKLLKILIRSVKKLIMSNATHDKDSGLEAEKRINTLSNIIFGVGKIAIWVIFLMIVLEKFGVNIAPIIAGAGIVGLAVGFGAQELVRDFISGFLFYLKIK